MKKLMIGVIALFCPLLFAQSAAEDVQAKLNAIRTMKANFNQTVKAGKRNVSTSMGSMALSRPGRFRWETKDPMEQLVIADSERLWVYDVDLEQVTVKKQEKGVGGTPGLFLSGYSDNVTRDFTVTSVGKGTTQTYDLCAKSPKENYQRLKLTFVGNDLRVLEFYDQLGQHTTVRLTKIQSNPSIPAALFQFKPPKGVDVVKQ